MVEFEFGLYPTAHCFLMFISISRRSGDSPCAWDQEEFMTPFMMKQINFDFNLIQIATTVVFFDSHVWGNHRTGGFNIFKTCILAKGAGFWRRKR